MHSEWVSTNQLLQKLVMNMCVDPEAAAHCPSEHKCYGLTFQSFYLGDVRVIKELPIIRKVQSKGSAPPSGTDRTVLPSSKCTHTKKSENVKKA